MNKKSLLIVLFLVTTALFLSNGYLLLKIKNLKIQHEINRRQSAEIYAKQLEYQHEITKNSIETVTQETNLYIDLNSELQRENDGLRNDMLKMLKNNECANSNIPDDVRSRLFSQP